MVRMGEGWNWEGEDDSTYGEKGGVGKERMMVRTGRRVGLGRRGRWYVWGKRWGWEGEDDGTYGGWVGLKRRGRC